MKDSAPHPEAYQRRARIGAIALFARTGLAQLIILGGTVVLARHLRPAEFGVFAMVQFALTLLTLFGDAGLGGALVQRAEAPSEQTLSSVFWAQLLLTLPVLALAWGLGEVLPWIWPDIPAGAAWLLRALAMNFVFTSARVVPTLLMERELLFVRVAVLDTVGNVMFYLVSALLSLNGFGVWSLVLGVLAQGAAGLISAYVLRPWRPSFFFDFSLVRGLLGFGLPFQARTGLFLLTRSVIPVLGGTMFGSTAVGTLNWALETSFFPLTFVEILSRVSFPLYSRLQGHPEQFAAEIEKSLRVGVAITLFLSAMFLGLAPDLTEIIYSAQWLPAVNQLRLYAATIALGTLVYLLAPAFDAMGKPRPVMVQMLIVAALVWILVPLLARQYGLEGFVAGHLIAVLVGAVLILFMAKATLPKIPLLSPYFGTGIAGAGVVLLGHFVLSPWTNGPVTLFASVVSEILFFLALLWTLDKKTFLALKSRLPERKPQP